ncbi:MAG: hypothetical protein PHD43_12115 [Methylococcales bacterium]|nr:hypothetical protein [Methylococcales bacterium]
MRKQTIQYSSPLDALIEVAKRLMDALIEVAKRLSILEQRQNMDSEEFFYQYSQGLLSDDAVFVEWANDYRHYLYLRQELDKKLKNVA